MNNSSLTYVHFISSLHFSVSLFLCNFICSRLGPSRHFFDYAPTIQTIPTTAMHLRYYNCDWG